LIKGPEGIPGFAAGFDVSTGATASVSAFGVTVESEAALSAAPQPEKVMEEKIAKDAATHKARWLPLMNPIVINCVSPNGNRVLESEKKRPVEVCCRVRTKTARLVSIACRVKNVKQFFTEE
jgi:hypothetical protein